MTGESDDRALAELRDAVRQGDHVVVSESIPKDGLPIRTDGMLERIETLASLVEPSATRLKGLMTEFDCVPMLDAVRYSVQPPILDEVIPDNAPEIFSLDAKVEYLQGLAVTSTRGTRTPTQDSISEVVRLAEKVFEAEQAKVLLRSLTDDVDRKNGVDEASMLLGMESLIDRMQGYSKHLDEMYSAVFQGLKAECESEFGFCPADVAGLVRSIAREINVAVNSGLDVLFNLFQENAGVPPDPDTIPVDDLKAIETGVRSLFEPSVWDPSVIASWTGHSQPEIEAMLMAMSTPWRYQPEFLLPSDQNRLRTHTIVPLDNGTFWVPRTWDLLHSLLDWWNIELRERSLDRLKARYERARDKETELVAERLMVAVFGRENVHASQHFDGSEGHGEVDVLVGSSEYPIAIEAKAASLTVRGRLGVPDRVERVAGDIILRGHEQLAKVAGYIASGGRTFAEREGGPELQLLADGVTHVVPIVVTFERMDPLASWSSQLSNAVAADAAWVVSLADFMMVAEVLPSPTEFLGYADLRAKLASSPINTYMESDVLELYLGDRLGQLIEIGQSGETSSVSLGYSSTAINAFFTAEEMDMPATRPSSGVPAPVLDLLGTEVGTPGWGAASLAVMRVPPGQWKKWQKFVRRRGNRGRRTTKYQFEEEGLVVAIAVHGGSPIGVDADGLVTVRILADSIARP